jgi:fumarate reductase iron-sulfur subunit
VVIACLDLVVKVAGGGRRLEIFTHPEGVWACPYVGECSRACPTGVDPAGAIQRARLTTAKDSIKDSIEAFVLPRGAG